MDMCGTVLQIQGSRITAQPLLSEATGSLLVWNGEYLNHEISDLSDTNLVLALLESTDDVAATLARIEGPFAFVYFDNPSSTLWFGKDKVGRRSLLASLSADRTKLIISSTALEGGSEIPAGFGIYKLSLNSPSLDLVTWPHPSSIHLDSFLAGTLNADLDHLHSAFRSGIRRHMESISVPGPFGILFSGGLDSVIMTCIASDLFPMFSKKFTSIDLINVACADCDSPDRSTGLVSFEDLLTKYPSVPFRFVCVDISPADLEAHQEHIVTLASPNTTLMDFNISSALWFGSRADGHLLDPSFLKNPEWTFIRSQILSAESLENAAENRRTKKDTETYNHRGPCVLCCKRKAKPGCIKSACKMCCKDTACLGHNGLGSASVNTSVCVADFLRKHSLGVYQSTCRILLVGHGADELFGGYGRHATRNERLGAEGLRQEMLLDLGRLWQRNLGRDDRVMADHGRDVRHPFLDECVVEYVGQLSVHALGSNKQLLRDLCRELLGVIGASMFRKRAIQFGTRLAQKTNQTVFGSHSKGSGTDVYRLVS